MTSTPAKDIQGKALFVRRGKFSHANESLLAAMRLHLPHIAFEDLNVDDLLPVRGLGFAACVLGAVSEYGPGTLRNRDQLRYRVLRSKAWYNASRRLIRARSLAQDYMFTVQTQSLFNAANGRVPNLIYTDHAALLRESTTWDDNVGRPSRQWLALEAEIYRDAHHVFTFGSGVRRDLIDRYGVAEDRVSVCGTGANIAPDGPVVFDLARYARRNILFAGIEWDRKGGPDLVAAFVKLRARLPDATLTVVGCTPAETVGLEGCSTLGRVPRSELARLYQEASCLCGPSRHEPFGNAFVEAGQFGLPVVATNVGEIGDVVHDGVNGFRVPPRDPEALAEALWMVLRDPHTAMKMGQAGIRVTANHTWNAVAAKILDHAPVRMFRPE